MANRDPRIPAVGTVIVRIYKAQQIQVLVQEDGFTYEGERYKSISALATKLAGCETNGYKFFNLVSAPSATEAVPEKAPVLSPATEVEPVVPEKAKPTEKELRSQVELTTRAAAQAVADLEAFLKAEAATKVVVEVPKPTPSGEVSMSELRKEMLAIAGVKAQDWDKWDQRKTA